MFLKYSVKVFQRLLFAVFLFSTNDYCFAQNELVGKDFLKIPITNTGVYKIDYNYLIKSGLSKKSTFAIPQLYTNSGNALSQVVKDGPNHKISQLSYGAKGLEDGTFNEKDYIYFFAEGPHVIRVNQETKEFFHKVNPYHNSNYVFLTFGTKINTLENHQTIIKEADNTISTTDSYWYEEKELKSLLKYSGRNWYGPTLNTFSPTLEITVPFKNSIIGSNAIVTSKIIGNSLYNETNAELYHGGKTILKHNTPEIYGDIYGQKGFSEQAKATFAITENKLTYKLLSSPKNSQSCLLDFVSVQYKSQLVLDPPFTIFQNLDASFSNSISKYTFESPTIPKIWEVSDPIKPKEVIATNTSFSFKHNNTPTTFVAFTEDKLETPPLATKGKFTELLQNNNTNFVIITVPDFMEAANNLAQFRTKSDGLLSQVIDVNQIYNYYSSGKKDPTAIRNFLKEYYQFTDKKLAYCLLLGDASFDYKNNSKDLLPAQQERLIPTYQSSESLHNVKTYCSDDYFSFLEDQEGAWNETENNADNHTMDIAIGRIPVNTPEQAHGVINKIINYTQNPTVGEWQRRLSFVADDSDGNLHQTDAEDLIKLSTSQGTDFSIKRIFVDNYPRVNAKDNRLSPETNKQVKNSFYNGSLIFNYVGHGGINNLADEKILLDFEMRSWKNSTTLPLMVTATCEFGRFDDHGILTGAEQAILNPSGGAIALLTTTRPVYASSNKVINEAFYKAFFKLYKQGEVRLGDLLKETKNTSFQYIYNRNFSLLGDPSMALFIPNKTIEIESINNKKPTLDTLNAGETITIKGKITDPKVQKLANTFNGNISIKLFDKPTKQETLGNNLNSKMNYTNFNSLLVNTVGKVTNGMFTVQCQLPKEINYQVGKGRIELFATDTLQNQQAIGGTNDILVGLSNSTATTDTQSPSISFLKRANYKAKDPISFQISDNSGINLNEQLIGREIRIDIGQAHTENITSKYTPYYTTIGSTGSLTYQLPELPSGNYQVTLSAWDIFNNKAVYETEISIDNSNTNSLGQVTILPNPVEKSSKVQFYNVSKQFNSNATISYYTENGQLIAKSFIPFLEPEALVQTDIPLKVFETKNKGSNIFIFSIELKNLDEGSAKYIYGQGKGIFLGKND
jgi:hypothetical protein